MAFVFTAPKQSSQSSGQSSQPFIGPKPKPASYTNNKKTSKKFVFTAPSQGGEAKQSESRSADYGTESIKKLSRGGAYTSVKGEPNKIVKSERAYANLPTSPYSERDHIIPVSLGGTSTKENLRPQEYSIGGKIKQAVNTFTDALFNKKIFDKPEQPSYKTEMSALKDYEAGKISLPEARLRVISFKDQQELKKQGVTQSVFKNFIKILPETAYSFTRDLSSAIAKPFAETALTAIRLNQLMSNTGKAILTGKKTVENPMGKPVEITVDNPVLKKILNYGDRENLDDPVKIKINPLFSGKENPIEFSKKIVGGGSEIGSLLVGGEGLKTSRALLETAKKPIAQLGKDTLLKLSKQLAVEKLLPGMTAGGLFGGGEALKENESPVEILKATFTTALIGGLFELALTPFAIRGVVKKEGKFLTNSADPTISYKEKPTLGKDSTGSDILVKTEINPRTGESVVTFRQDLKSQPAVFLRVINEEHGKIVEAKLGKIKPEGTVLSKVLDDFAEKSGRPKEEISQKISFEVKKLGGSLEEAVIKIKENPKVFETKAPTLKSLLEHRVDPDIITTKVSTTEFVDKMIKEVKAKVPKVGKTELDSPLHQEARKYKSAEEFVKRQTDPLFEFKTGVGIKDPDIARGTVKEAISDIGGLRNVRRGLIDPKKLEVSENININSTRYKKVLDEVKKGERTPIIVNQYGEIMDGHHRLKAYEEIGLKEIPVVAPKEFSIITQTKSQLTDIWNKANKLISKKPKSIDDYNKKLPEKLKMKHPKEAKQLESHANKKKPDALASRVYDRLKSEVPEKMRENVAYNEINLKKDAEKAVSLIARNKERALKIALNMEEPPAGQTATAINIALAEKARLEGNYQLYSDLVKSRSLEQTRRGQEIVAEKGSISDNSMDRYVKELISARLTKLGKNYLSDARDMVSNIKKRENMSPNQRGLERIKSETKIAMEKVKKGKMFDLAEAQKFIDSLAC